MMTLTNASIMFTAFIVSAVCVIIVFVSGVMSGVVRMNTLLTRTLFAFLMSGAASYFLLMLFDWYYEKHYKKDEPEQVNAEIEQAKLDAESDEAAENPTPTEPAQEGFKPMNANDLPKA